MKKKKLKTQPLLQLSCFLDELQIAYFFTLLIYDCRWTYFLTYRQHCRRAVGNDGFHVSFPTVSNLLFFFFFFTIKNYPLKLIKNIKLGSYWPFHAMPDHMKMWYRCIAWLVQQEQYNLVHSWIYIAIYLEVLGLQVLLTTSVRTTGSDNVRMPFFNLQCVQSNVFNFRNHIEKCTVVCCWEAQTVLISDSRTSEDSRRFIGFCRCC